MTLPSWSRSWSRYLIALGAVALASLFRYALNPYVGTRLPYVAFYFATIPVASRLGVGPSLVALGLSTAVAAFCFVEPAHGWNLAGVTETIGMILFVLVNLTLIGFAESSRVARRRLEGEVAERTRAEAALRSAKQAAEEANRAKDRFIAVLSHELRTPLNPAALTIKALLGRDDQPDEVRRDLEAVQHYVGVEARLIDDLLDVMRIDRGQLALRWEVVDLHHLLGTVARELAGEVAQRRLRLDLDLRAPGHYAQADPGRLRQVFGNLLRNAVKFTPSGGSITLQTRAATAPERTPEARRVVSFTPLGDDPGPASAEGQGDAEGIVVEVADTGIGVEPAALARIFEPFQQADPTINRRYGGLGLGLAICSGIVDGHGGTLQARSDGSGRGTTFAVRLRTTPAPTAEHAAVTVTTAAAAADPPLASASPTLAVRPSRPDPAPTPVGPASAASPSGLEPSLCVLVVEDEPATIRVMSRLLRSLGHRVTTAVTLAEASDHVTGSAPFDLLVSDIGLPDGSGLDLMRRARMARPALPAIALTGFGTDADIEQSRLAGFAAHMTKPIDFDQLAILIRRIAATHS